MIQKFHENKKIQSCNDHIIITDFETGEVICQKCGKILQEKITDQRKESVPQNEYMPTSLMMHDMGLSTIIGKLNRDSGGKPLGYEMRQSINRMRLWDSRSQVKTSADRNLRSALYEMLKLKEKLGLSDAIIDRAAYLYRKAGKAQLIRGRTIKSIVGACMYAACREMETTRTIRDIASHLQEKRKIIAKAYRILFQNIRITIPITDPINCIIKFANNLQLPEITKREAIKIFDILKEKELTVGKNPHGVAATVIYMACIKTNQMIIKQEIIKVSGITAITIRNRLTDYEKYINY
ncbi:MAG: transcription initiation factor IIB [Nitrosarchaeum sp.]|nr:transcription initiation factor IIB [Nitrosarchaeum sp.]PHY10006.1 MAG: transcription initiation factor IIB [Nitrosarchaeum sp.]